MLKVRLLTETLQGDIDRHKNIKQIFDNIIDKVRLAGEEIPVFDEHDYYDRADLYCFFPEHETFIIVGDNFDKFKLYIKLPEPKKVYLEILFDSKKEAGAGFARHKMDDIAIDNKFAKLCRIEISFNKDLLSHMINYVSMDKIILKLFDNQRSIIMHELTHIFDITLKNINLGRDKQYYEPDENYRKYIKDGVELNARWSEFLDNIGYFLYQNYTKNKKIFNPFYSRAARILRIDDLNIKKQKKIEKKLIELFYNGPYKIPNNMATTLAFDMDSPHYNLKERSCFYFDKLTKENQKIVKKELYRLGYPGIEYEDLEKE